MIWLQFTLQLSCQGVYGIILSDMLVLAIVPVGE